MHPAAPSGFRSDIQALRGIAVLYVLVYHTDAFWLPGGYLGVDLFFVISGYLITKLVCRGIDQGTFSFSEFYFRRAKRLLPAAYVTFLVTALLAPSMLNDAELNDYYSQLIGALTFTANIVLFSQSGYFAGEAELKPLLHIWSLSLEEQYYFLLPAAMWLIPRRHRLSVVAMAALASLLLCFALIQHKPIATFYLLPTRAWELGLGSILAVLPPALDRHQRLLARFLFWPAVLALVIVPLFPLAGPHPGTNALIVCIATAIIILRNHASLQGAAPVRGLARIGDISYSLYLAHWPVFAFVRNASVSAIDTATSLATLALSLLLGYLLFRFVEFPFRRMEVRRTSKLLAKTLLASIVIALVPVSLSSAYQSDMDFTHIRRSNDGFSAECIVERDFVAKPDCANADAPAILLWGDSYAMHLASGLAATTHRGVLQATMGMCGPVLDAAPLSSVFYTQSWAKACSRYNRQVVDYLAQAANIEIVVLGSAFRQYLPRHDVRHDWRLQTIDADGRTEPRELSPDLALDLFGRTISTLRAIGKKVVVVGPPASSNFNVGACIERRAKGKFVFGAPTEDCSIPASDHDYHNAAVIQFLDALEDIADVHVIRLDRALCDDSLCRVTIDQTYLYVDRGHLTHEGSVALAQRIALGRLIEERAR